MNNEEKLIERIASEYIDVSDTSVEILCPFEEKEFALKLKNRLNTTAYITYTNGPIQKEIEKDYRKFLDDRIAFYTARIQEEFTRITILSPFPMPIPLTNSVMNYRKDIHELDFLNEYLYTAQRCMIVKPNQRWANRLGLSLEELWNKVNDLYDKKSILNEKIDDLNRLPISKLRFITKEGTDVSFRINPLDKFTGKYLYRNGKRFQANAPSMEIFIAPIKDSGEGRIVFTKPFIYKGRRIENHSILLSKGKVIEQSGLDEIISLDESLSYIGEIGICPYDSFIYENTLLDENSGCHIALGGSYPYGITDRSLVNQSIYHYDLVFGSDSLSCIATVDNQDLYIIREGEVVL